MVVSCPFSGESIDVSCVLFVDDLFRVVILDRLNAAHVALTVAQNDRALDERLWSIDTEQNTSKLEYTGVFFWPVCLVFRT